MDSQVSPVPVPTVSSNYDNDYMQQIPTLPLEIRELQQLPWLHSAVDMQYSND